MISTMASRDTRAFVGTKDILMLHSVCDLAGLNRFTRKILRNGALALAGMLQPTAAAEDQITKPRVANLSKMLMVMGSSCLTFLVG